MALIKCPECGKEISDAAIVCPQCGFPIAQASDQKPAPTAQLVRKTELGQVTKDTAGGALCIVIGIACIAAGIFLVWLPMIAGFLFLSAVVLFAVAKGKFTGAQEGTCPYCGNKVKMSENAGTCRCGACEKISTKKDGFLFTLD